MKRRSLSGNSQQALTAYTLRWWADDEQRLVVENPSVNAFYEEYISDLSETFGQSREYIELKIYGWRRYQSRKTRYDMSLAAGKFIDRRKLP